MKTQAEIEAWLLNPPPGSKAAAARDFGIDLTLTLENLRLTPEERIRRLDALREAAREIRVAARKSLIR